MAESQSGAGSSGNKRSKGTNAGKRAMAGVTQDASTVPPCGACKFLRRKCSDGCIFAPYFGTDQGAARFAAVHKVFGASNVSKLLSSISTNHRHEAAATISYEAQARLSDPVYGCVSTILALQQQVAAMQAEVSMMHSQLMNRRYAYASAHQTTHHQQQHQILQQPNFNVSVQPAYSNNSSASTNNFMNMNSFNPGFDLTMETARSSQSLEPFQNSRMSHYEEDD
ncbi:LOB domain-containing protein 20-like [Trifolium pratense]|uniref:LOB domain-containing protein 20-like n=1 Tax=Trifolium pratense TaxID=57577 RepID=A0A2K3N585_TRIPR|nr:LOB domain-containing protein 20-like [Trifolium pratense]PNX98210.1 LOB domain-containing protein 20-like [Trifolium pratense]